MRKALEFEKFKVAANDLEGIFFYIKIPNTMFCLHIKRIYFGVDVSPAK